MTNVVFLNEYRIRRGEGIPDGRALAHHLNDVQSKLAAASHEFRSIALRLEVAAENLGHCNAIQLESARQEIRSALQRLDQCKVDSEEICRLIESADIDGCLRLRNAILSRTQG